MSSPTFDSIADQIDILLRYAMNETTGRTARIYRRLISVTGSLELTTIGLLWLFGLVLAGTFYQLGHSIHETTLTFFHSWLIYAGPIPLPAGQLLVQQAHDFCCRATGI